MQTNVVYIIFALLSLLVLAKRPLLSGLGLAAAAWFVYFPDTIFHSDMSRDENLKVAGLSVGVTLILCLYKLKNNKLRFFWLKRFWGNWWVRFFCYVLLVMILPRAFFRQLSLYHAALYPAIFILISVAASCVQKWQAIFWSITWFIIFNILTNYVGIPQWPWEAPTMYIAARKNVIFNLTIAYEAMWLSLLLGISLAFSNWKLKRITLLIPSFIYFVVTWLIHWSRSLTLSLGLLLALSTFAMQRMGKFWLRTSLSIIVGLILISNYFTIVPWILEKSSWIDFGTETRIKEKLIDNIYKDDERVMLFETTLNTWKGHPIFGVGFLRSGDIVADKTGGEGPHSGLLMLLAEGGLLAAMLFILGLIDILRRTKPWVNAQNHGEKELRCLVFLGILSLLPRMMFDGFFYNTPMLAILVVTGYRITELTQTPPSKHNRRPN